MELVASTLIPIRNRPGFFAVVPREVAQALHDGQMRLYISSQGVVDVETITRNRRSLTIYDPHYRVVFVAVDQHGDLITQIPA